MDSSYRPLYCEVGDAAEERNVPSQAAMKDFIPHDHSLAKPTVGLSQKETERGKTRNWEADNVNGNSAGGISMKPARSNGRKLPAVKEFSKVSSYS